MATLSAPVPQNDPPIHFAPKSWVAETEGQFPELGRIKAVYWDNIAKEWVMDIVLYSPEGTRIGRSSPRRGGPSGFEPAVPCKYWMAIKKPDFPLQADSTGHRDWRNSLEVIN